MTDLLLTIASHVGTFGLGIGGTLFAQKLQYHYSQKQRAKVEQADALKKAIRLQNDLDTLYQSKREDSASVEENEIATLVANLKSEVSIVVDSSLDALLRKFIDAGDSYSDHDRFIGRSQYEEASNDLTKAFSRALKQTRKD